VTGLQIIFTPQAEQQLEALYAYIPLQSNEERAEKYIRRIIDMSNSLMIFPMRGRLYEHLQPGLRIIGFECRVCIAYVPSSDVVRIIGIFYGGRDFTAVLQHEP